MKLSNLQRADRKKARKRVGRGESSGLGKTCGKGHKGLKSRSGGSPSPGFEGGQMPLQRRLPKKGFNNPFKTYYNVVNVKDLERFESGSIIDGELLRKSGLVRRSGPVKLLAVGDVTLPYVIKLQGVSEAAARKIVAAGGSVEQ
jgi:large subunit ribosomal protein L15